MNREREKTIAELEEILDLKSQGWSDLQIRKELKLDNKAFDARMKLLHKSERLKIEALHFLVETMHRIRWLRMSCLTQFEAAKKSGKSGDAARYMSRLIEIDTSVPKIAEQLGWRPDDLQKYLDTGKVSNELEKKSEDELYREYNNLIRSRVRPAK